MWSPKIAGRTISDAAAGAALPMHRHFHIIARIARVRGAITCAAMRNFGAILLLAGILGFFYSSSRLEQQTPLPEGLTVRESLELPAGRWEIARYAWLAGDRRLQEIGIKTFVQRGEGTDFKQLSEYRYGDSVRHIDWKATLRLDKPIVREFQDERDQRVMLLIDCGRRMRADDRHGAIGTAHFDQVLNAVMLIGALVALIVAFARCRRYVAPGTTRSHRPRGGPSGFGAYTATRERVTPRINIPRAREISSTRPG